MAEAHLRRFVLGWAFFRCNYNSFMCFPFCWAGRFFYAAISDAFAVAAGCRYLSWLHVKHLFDHFGSFFLLTWRVMDVMEHLGFVLLKMQEAGALFQERQCKDTSRECGPRSAELFAAFSLSHPALLPWPFQQVPPATLDAFSLFAEAPVTSGERSQPQPVTVSVRVRCPESRG